VFERRGNVGHEVVNVLEPKFTPDGKQLIAVLDEQGYRQPYIISTDNSNGSGSAKAILKGDFEAHQIIGFTPDSKSMFVLANKDDFASMNAYKVDIASGEMKALGQTGDFHRASDVADSGDKLASVAGQWSNRPELKLIDVKTSKITPSRKVTILCGKRLMYNNQNVSVLKTATAIRYRRMFSSQRTGKPAICVRPSCTPTAAR
jgi:hypothetical protein